MREPAGTLTGKPAKRRDIQGLRALAVVSVVLYHAYPFALPGGFVGVDVFFVISGFVISKTILQELEDDTFSLARFYRRRVRRIFPALYVMLAAVTAVSWLLLAPHDLRELGKTGLAAVLFVANIAFLRLSGYFDGSVHLKPLLHTWSLSVEEQFYLVYPFYIATLRRYGHGVLRASVAILALGSLAFSAWMVHTHSAGAFYLAPSRAFELLLGGLVACGAPVPVRWGRARDVASIAGLAAIAVAFAFYRSDTPFPGVAALLPSMGSALVIWCGSGRDSAAGRLISGGPFQLLGDLSYSLYLWHWPILVLSRYYHGGELGPLGRALCVGAAVGAAALSLRYVERPLLDERRAGWPLLRMGVAVMAGAATGCLALFLGEGFPARFAPGPRALFAAADDYNPRRSQCHLGEAVVTYDHSCVFGAEGSTPDTAVWGDSHGAELVVALGERLKAQGRAAMELTTSACPPAVEGVPGDCREHNLEMLRRVSADSRVHTVVLVGHYSNYRDAPLEVLFEGVSRVVQQLVEHGKRVVIVDPIPTMDFDPPSLLGARAAAGQSIADLGIEEREFRRRNEQVMRLLDGIEHAFPVTRVSPGKSLCAEGLCRVYAPEGGVLYFNPNHLSISGARVVAKAWPL